MTESVRQRPIQDKEEHDRESERRQEGHRGGIETERRMWTDGGC